MVPTSDADVKWKATLVELAREAHVVALKLAEDSLVVMRAHGV